MDSIMQLYGLAMVIVPVYAFVSLRKRIRHERLARSAALIRYCGYVIAPVLGYAAIFGVALAVEAVLPVALVSEEIARSFALAMVLGMLLCLLAITIFALALLFVRGSSGARREEHGAHGQRD